MEKKQSDSNILLRDFEAFSSELEQNLFDITDIEEIIKNTIKLSNYFLKPLPLTNYVDLHTSSLSYFSSLKKYLSKRNIFTEQTLKDGYRIAFACETLIPRMYTVLMISCALEEERRLKTLAKTLLSVTNPLRGMVLRYTAISFFPTKSDLLIEFARENYSEMLYLVPRFLKIYPEAVNQVSEWVSANISIALFICKDSDDLFNHFFQNAVLIENQEVAVNIVSSIEQNIETNMLINHFSDFQGFINKIDINEKTSILAENIIRHAKLAKDAFQFVREIKFRNDFAILLTQIAIDQKDYDTIKECATLWPQEDVFNLIFSICGHNKFVTLVPSIQNGAEISLTFVKTATTDVLPSALRKVLENEMVKRTPSMDELLTNFTKDNHLSSQFIQTVFSPPFIVHGEHMLKSLVFQAFREKMDHTFISNMIMNSKLVSDETKVSLLCTSLQKDQVNEIIPFITTPFCMSIFLTHYFYFDIKKEHIPILSKLCKTKHLLLLCGMAFALSDFDDAAAELFSTVCSNFQSNTIKETIDLNLEVISSIASVYTHSPKSEEIARNLFDQNIDIAKCVLDSIFPIATPEQCNKWIRMAKSISNIMPNLKIDDFVQYVKPSDS